jgi:demethoxyubiquinone hydroxylase (CLK1/Coq7/Cat5 family)
VVRVCITQCGIAFTNDEPGPGVSTFPSLDISPEQREILDDALRVNQSGEITVNWMYRGQVTVLGHDPRVGSLIQVSHLETAIQPLSIDLIW